MDFADFVAYAQLTAFSLAPDGERACYISDAAGLPSLYLTPMSRAEPTALAPDLTDVTGCRWRPDGARIVVTVDADGRENSQLAEVDPADEQMLVERSPITHADAIRAPLLVIHGSHDARVDPGESSRLVDRLRELDRPVTYLPILGLDHSEGGLDTRARLINTIVDFVIEHLKPTSP